MGASKARYQDGWARAPSRGDHDAAAFLASVSTTQDLCGSIDGAFDVDDAGGHLQLATTRRQFRDSILPDAVADVEGSRHRQKFLSALIDAKLQSELTSHPQADASFQTHLALQSMHGAGAWLTAHPSDDARTLEPLLFKLGTKRRLRMRVQDTDTFCPMCGGTMDSYGDHALVCPCKGDRTVRHNRLRDCVYEDAKWGSMSPEREKAGLLPGRPQEDGVQCTDTEPDSELPAAARSRRRPADIFFPRAINGVPTALDFACTSGLRADVLWDASTDPNGVITAYEQFKKDYVATGETVTTETLCSRQGITFAPMVIEAHGGGWSKRARQILDTIAKHVSSSWNQNGEAASLSIAQRLSATLHRENARAVLRRLQEPIGEEVANDWTPGDLMPLW